MTIETNIKNQVLKSKINSDELIARAEEFLAWLGMAQLVAFFTSAQNGKLAANEQFLLLHKKFSLVWGHSMTTWTQFCPFLTTTYFYVDIFNPGRGQKWRFFGPPTTSSCPRSH